MFRHLKAGSSKTFGKIPAAVIRDSMLFDNRCPHLITSHSGRGAVVEGGYIRLCEGTEKASLWTEVKGLYGERALRPERIEAAGHCSDAAPCAGGGIGVKLSEAGSQGVREKDVEEDALRKAIGAAAY